MKQVICINEYGLTNFSASLEKAFLEGYRLDLLQNEGVPTAWGSFYECNVYREATDTGTDKSIVETSDTVPSTLPLAQEGKPAVEDSSIVIEAIVLEPATDSVPVVRKPGRPAK